MTHEEKFMAPSYSVLTDALGLAVPVTVSLRGNHGEPNEVVPWLAFLALSPCEAVQVWVLVHILETALHL